MKSLNSPRLPILREPLHARVAQRIEAELRKGTWPDFLPNERLLAETFQVSRMTLREALKQLEQAGWISSGRGLRRRVLKSHADRSGKTVTRNILFLSPVPLEAMEFRMVTLIHMLTTALFQNGIRLHLEARPSCFSRHPQRALQRLYEEQTPDGWVLFRVTEAMENWFHQTDLPHVIIGNTFIQETPSFGSPADSVSNHAASQFQRLGHRRIGILMPKHDVLAPMDIAVEKSFQRAAPELQNLILFHDRTRAGIIRSVDRLLRAQPAITGIFSTGGQYSLLVLTHLLNLGIRVPTDMSLLIWGDDPAFQYVDPLPAYYDYPIPKAARQLCRLVQQVVLYGSERRLKIQLLPEFKTGESLGPAPH